MCPVVVFPFNVSPDMYLKDTNYILSLLIPGPKVPTSDIDVYFQLLVDELNDLWNNDTITYDASKKENIKMHAIVLCKINNLPAYAKVGYVR